VWIKPALPEAVFMRSMWSGCFHVLKKMEFKEHELKKGEMEGRGGREEKEGKLKYDLSV
jgi:hypothetical protein